MKIVVLFSLFSILLATSLRAQRFESTAGTIARSGSNSEAPVAFPRSAATVFYDSGVLIANRARILGNRVSLGDRTRYFAITSTSVQDKHEESVNQLSPVIHASDGVRSVRIFVDLPRKLTIDSNRPIFVGSTTIDGRGFSSLDVQTIIKAVDVRISPKN